MNSVQDIPPLHLRRVALELSLATVGAARYIGVNVWSVIPQRVKWENAGDGDEINDDEEQERDPVRRQETELWWCVKSEPP